MQGKRIQDLSYTYDNVGNITQIIDESETNTKKKSVFEYDDLYRLTSATISDSYNDYTRTYSYDSLGNFDSTDLGTYSYEGNTGTSYANPHAVTGIGSAADLEYDNNGNLTNLHIGSFVLIGADYDYNNRITETLRPNSQTSTYKYDHTGERIGQDTGTKDTIYANKYFEETTEGANTSDTMNIYAQGQLLGTAESDGESFNLHLVHGDHLNSSSVMTDFDTNAAVDQVIDYYPFGGIRFNEQNSTTDQGRKFTGKIGDSSTTLQYFGARYYQGDVGRFWSIDPLFLIAGDKQFKNIAGYDLIYYLSEPQNLNSYSYVTNNPLKYVDPLGLDKYINTKGETVKDTGNGDKSYYEQDDINMLNQNASYMEQNKLNFSKFYDQVRSGGDWDYKQQDREFFFNGSLYSSEDFGNLNYGYCGTAGGFSKGLLKDMAGVVSIKTTKNYSDLVNYGILNNFDQPIDVTNINLGVKTYMSTHKNDSTFTAKTQQLVYHTTLQPLFFRTVGLEYMAYRAFLNLIKN
ncbi:MAG: RHS repeat-associated core domain-containing protein [Patescibacteria group bacterium]